MTIPSIRFNFLVPFALRDRTGLKRFLVSLFKNEKKKLGELRYIFCSDSYLLKINREYLNHDYYTDIITFDLSEENRSINAEIYISVDRVRENAREFGFSATQELHRVMFHGALHLCGYKDKTIAEKKLMREKEEQYLKGLIRSTKNGF